MVYYYYYYYYVMCIKFFNVLRTGFLYYTTCGGPKKNLHSKQYTQEYNISVKISLFSLGGKKGKAQACTFLYMVLHKKKVWRYLECFLWYVRLTEIKTEHGREKVKQE